MSGFSLPAALARRAGAGELAHAYILTGPDPEALWTAACGVAAAMVCTGEEKPCGMCRSCLKAARGVHPDLISVAPEPGKDLPVDRIRELRADAYVLPNESRRKVYLIREAERMNVFAQNAFLKVLEEGPPYAAFLLLTGNAAALLPTVRSRCETVRVGAAPGQTDPETERRGEELAGLLLGEDRWALISWSVPFEKAKREEVLPILEAARGAVLTYRGEKTAAKAVAVAQGLGEILAAGGRNLGVGALWGWVWTLQEG